MSRRSLAFHLGAVVFLIHASYQGGQGWNQGARLGAVYSFVEPGPHRFTFQIDPYLEPHPRGVWSQDWAANDGHFYPNKAPGSSILGVLAYVPLYAAAAIFGIDPAGAAFSAWSAHVINLFVSVLFTALATALFFLYLRRRGWLAKDALLSAGIYAFATLVFPFDTSLWGHGTSAALVLLMLLALGSGRGALAGLFAGAAVLTDYLAGISLLLGLLFLLLANRRQALVFLFGSLPPVLLLMLYQKLAFGGFFTSAFALSNPALMVPGEGVTGTFAFLSPATLAKLLVLPSRGIFLFMPVLALAFKGGALLWQIKANRALVLFCAANILLYVLAVSSFNGWHGGWSTGARYLIPSLPFFCFLLPPFSRLSPLLRVAYAGAALISCVNMWAIALIDTMVPTTETNPLYGYVYPMLLGQRGYVETHFALLPSEPLVYLPLSLCLLGLGIGFLLQRARQEDRAIR